MPSVNPGPAITSNPNSMLGTSPVNTQFQSGYPPLSGGQRLLAVARSIPILGTGDIAVVPIVNSTMWFPTAIYFTNPLSATGASASAAACNVSLNGGPAVTGTSIKAAALLAALTGTGTLVAATIAPTGPLLTATMGAGGGPSNFLYLNCTVVSAAAATMDMWVFGYDFT